jgi:CGNR zinc finger
MKRRRGTNEQAALEAGLPAARARRVVIHELDPFGGPGKFLTLEEAMRQFEMFDLACLRWLLNLATTTTVTEEAVTAEVASFVEPYLDSSATNGSETEVVKFLREFVAELKEFVQKRGSGNTWKIKVGEVSRTLSWEEITTSGSRYHSTSWRSAFLLRVTELINKYGNRIQHCSYSDCGSLFVGDGTGHQKFCSLKCGAAERQRRFRAKHPDWTDYRRRGRSARQEVQRRKQEWQAELKPGKETTR